MVCEGLRHCPVGSVLGGDGRLLCSALHTQLCPPSLPILSAPSPSCAAPHSPPNPAVLPLLQPASSSDSDVPENDPMAGSDGGDDEDDAAMATGPPEKVDSEEDSDRGSDHSGLKRKSLAMKVSVGWGQEGGPAWGHCGSAFPEPTSARGGGETNSLWILWWEMGLSVVLGVS